MCFLSCQERLTGRPLNFAPLDAIMLLKMWLDPGAPPQLAGLHIPPIGSQLVHSLSIISTKAHTSWLRNSFSWHAVADICCLRQQNVIFHYFHNLPLSQKLDPRLITYRGNVHPIDYSRDRSCGDIDCLQRLHRTTIAGLFDGRNTYRGHGAFML